MDNEIFIKNVPSRNGLEGGPQWLRILSLTRITYRAREKVFSLALWDITSKYETRIMDTDFRGSPSKYVITELDI